MKYALHDAHMKRVSEPSADRAAVRKAGIQRGLEGHLTSVFMYTDGGEFLGYDMESTRAVTASIKKRRKVIS